MTDDPPQCTRCGWPGMVLGAAGWQCVRCGLMPANDGPSITCPRCGVTSYHPKDVAEGYCGRCHDWSRDAR